MTTKHKTSVRFIFAWYDFWVGAYLDEKNRRLYILPVPMFGICIQLKPIKQIGCPQCQQDLALVTISETDKTNLGIRYTGKGYCRSCGWNELHRGWLDYS